MLETAETRWGPQAARQFRRGTPPAAHLLAARLNKGRPAPYAEPQGHASGPAVQVRVNHGRWLADCLWCESAQHASSDGFFYCAHCLNSSVGHRTVPQVWPRNREAIETHLSCRPDPATRNWHPSETLAMLKRENKEHGL